MPPPISRAANQLYVLTDDYISSVEKLVVTVETGASSNSTCATLYRHNGALVNAAVQGRILMECSRGPLENVRMVTLAVHPMDRRRARFLLCELVVF